MWTDLEKAGRIVENFLRLEWRNLPFWLRCNAKALLGSLIRVGGFGCCCSKGAEGAEAFLLCAKCMEAVSGEEISLECWACCCCCWKPRRLISMNSNWTFPLVLKDACFCVDLVCYSIFFYFWTVFKAITTTFECGEWGYPGFILSPATGERSSSSRIRCRHWIAQDIGGDRAKFCLSSAYAWMKKGCIKKVFVGYAADCFLGQYFLHCLDF